LAQIAQRHAESIVTNIKTLEEGQKMKEYIPLMNPSMLISLGPKKTMLVRSDKVLMEGFLMRQIKSLVDLKTLGKLYLS